jgi:hydrogenase maturation factor
VVREAAAACAALGPGGVHAMHDPTEGGLATALYEMAAASGLGLEVREEDVSVLAETRRLCEAASLAPLGLLASGSLLIAVAEEDWPRTLDALSEAGVAAARIGSMVKQEAGVIIYAHARAAPVPRFARDEVARFLAG